MQRRSFLLFLSRQNKRSNYHSHANLTGKLRNCNSSSFATSTHASLLKSGHLNDILTTNHLINSYKRLQNTSYAHKLFDEMSEPNVVSFTSLMAAYVDMGQPKFAIWLYNRMPESSVLPNYFTLATVTNACSMLADLKTGKKMHAHVEIFGCQGNLVVCSSLVDMYGKCNDVDGARRVFDLMSCRNVVSWTSMIAAYAQNARGHEALEVFREFGSKSMQGRSNHFMLTSVINACASLGKLVSGKVAHGAVIRRRYEVNDVVSSALVDMYANGGCFSYSHKVFMRIPKPSVISYTSIIMGAAKYGLGKLSLQLFEEMLDRRIKPNNVTFLGVLHACSHSGFVDQGLEHLNSMHEKHGIMPDAKHYTCIVDMLSRCGRLDEAYQLAKSIRVNLNEGALLWSTLLSASRLKGRVDIAVEASTWLIESNQQVAGAYVTLSNAYASVGKWENSRCIRSEMKRTGACKEPGCSWVEIKDSSYVFYAGNLSCEIGHEVVSLLKELERKMKETCYVGGSMALMIVDVEEEAKEKVSFHCESWH